MAPTDAALVERWRSARDADAFAEVVSRYAGMVYGTCCRILRNASDAEDVTQECFLALAQAQSPAPRSLGAWLHTVATRRSLDRIRSDKRRLRRESEAAAARTDAVRSDWDDVKAHVDEAIAALPEEWREPLVQRFLEGRRHEEIAELLDIPRATVQYRIGKGLDAVAGTLRRRGVTVAAAALASSLASVSAEAAPSALTASLGKLTIAAGSLPPSAAGASVASWLTKGGLLIMLKKGMLALLLVGALAGLSYGALQLAAPEAPPVAPNVVVAQAAPVPAPAPGAAAPAPAAPPAAPEASKEAEPKPGQVRTTGRVADAKGVAVADATVAFYVHGIEAGQIKTKEDGGFTWNLLAGKAYGVGACKPGVGSGYVEGFVPGAGGLTVRLRAAGSVSGRVADKGTGDGISGVQMAAEFVDPATVLASGAKPIRIPTRKTDADGRYTLVVPAPGKFRVLVLDSGAYVPTDDGGRELEVARDGTVQDIDFALPRGGAVYGRVFAPDGRPCAKAMVSTESQRAGVFGGRIVQSGEDGAFRIEGLAPGQAYRFAAIQKPYAACVSPRVNVPSADEVGPVDLRLTTGHAVRGRTVDAEGRPVQGIKILVFAIDPGGRSQAHTGVGMDPVVSDARGAFTLAPLGPGTYRINAHGRGGEAITTDFTMPANTDLADLEIQVKAPGNGVIGGRVVFPDGSPVENVQIQSMCEGGFDFAHTGTDGTFTLEGLADLMPHRLVVTHVTGYTNASMLQTALEDVPTGTAGLTITLGEVFEARGTVVDAATGKPITKFEALVAETHTPDGGLIATSSNAWRAFESPAGEFKLPLPAAIRAGSVVLAVRAEGYAETITEELPLDNGRTSEPVEIGLQSATHLSGIVTDSAGKPLEGARVLTCDMGVFPYLFEIAKPGSYAVTDSDGRFALSGVKKSGPVNVAACLEGYGLGAVTGAESQPSGVTIVLPPEARLKVTLTCEGKPVPGAQVQVSSMENNTLFGGVAQADAGGTALIKSLRPGQHTVAILAEAPAPAQWNGPVELAAGDNPMEFPLEPAGLIAGHLTAPNATGRIKVSGQRLDSPTRGIMADVQRDGRFSIVAMPGRWRVFASEDGITELSNAEEFELKPGEETALELVVP